MRSFSVLAPSPAAAAPVAARSTEPVCQGNLCTLASQLPGVGGLALGNGALFYATGVNGQAPEIWSMPVAGGAPKVIVKASHGGSFLELHDGTLYWTAQFWAGSGSKATTGVASAPATGGELKQLAQGESAIALALAVDESKVYWVGDAPKDEIDSADRAGGAATVLAHGNGNPRSLLVDEHFLYWPQGTKDHILKMSKTGGPPLAIADHQPWPFGMAQDATHLYWTCNGTPANHFDDGSIATMPKAGGKITVLATGQKAPSYIAVDDKSVYWANNQDHTMLSVPLSGGTPRVIASGQANVASIVTDGTYVYWSAAGDPSAKAGGSIMRMPK